MLLQMYLFKNVNVYIHVHIYIDKYIVMMCMYDLKCACMYGKRRFRGW